MRKEFTWLLWGNSLCGFYEEIVDPTLRRKLSSYIYDELARKYTLEHKFNEEMAFVVNSL